VERSTDERRAGRPKWQRFLDITAVRTNSPDPIRLRTALPMVIALAPVFFVDLRIRQELTDA
jgi:hypothetical protein